MNSDSVRVAVIGCGVIAPTHIQCYQHCPGVEVTMVCDLLEDRARYAAEKFQVAKWTTKAEEVFASPEVDAVSICTDHASHAALSCAALAAGKHVLCEKSLARTSEDLKNMLTAEAAHPELVASGILQHRFDPVPMALQRLLEEGCLGTLLTAVGIHQCLRTDAYYEKDAWRGTIEGEGGGVLINQSIHFFDLMLWITGDSVESLAGYKKNLAHQKSIETEDTVSLSMQLKKGALATFTASNASHLDWDWRLCFYGTKGSLELHNEAIEKCVFTNPEQEAYAKKLLDEAASLEREARGKSYYGAGHQSQIDDFIQAIRTKTAPKVRFFRRRKR